MKKTILKIVLLIIVVVVIAFLINTFRKFFIIQGLQENLETYLASTNYHIRITTLENNVTSFTTNIYLKEDNSLVTFENDNSKTSIYNDGNTTDIFTENSDGRKAELNKNTTISYSIPNYLKTENSWRTFCAGMFSSIKSVDVDGKDCYVIEGNLGSIFINAPSPSNAQKIYIEKDTGLCIQLINSDNTQIFEYEFDNVSDETFVKPNIEQYELIEE